jgi:hypothetical protein
MKPIFTKLITLSSIGFLMNVGYAGNLYVPMPAPNYPTPGSGYYQMSQRQQYIVSRVDNIEDHYYGTHGRSVPINNATVTAIMNQIGASDVERDFVISAMMDYDRAIKAIEYSDGAIRDADRLLRSFGQ